MRRRFLSVLLSLCLALGLLPTAAFAQGESYVGPGRQHHHRIWAVE